MSKRFTPIVFLLVSAPFWVLAKTHVAGNKRVTTVRYAIGLTDNSGAVSDTTKNGKTTAKADTKVKEVPKTKSQPKPEKLEDADAKKEKPKRERRPDGMQRPPEIPRRSDN